METSVRKPRRGRRAAVIIAAVLVCAAAAFAAAKLVSGKNFGLKASGTVGDSAAVFGISAPSSAASEYLKNVGYELVSADKSAKTVTLRISAPDLSGIGDIVKASAAKTAETDYDKRLSAVKADAAAALPSLPKITAEVTVPVEKKDGKWAIAPTEELYKAVYGQFETLLRDYYAKAIGGMTNEAPK